MLEMEFRATRVLGKALRLVSCLSSPGGFLRHSLRAFPCSAGWPWTSDNTWLGSLRPETRTFVSALPSVRRADGGRPACLAGGVCGLPGKRFLVFESGSCRGSAICRWEAGLEPKLVPQLKVPCWLDGAWGLLWGEVWAWKAGVVAHACNPAT